MDVTSAAYLIGVIRFWELADEESDTMCGRGRTALAGFGVA